MAFDWERFLRGRRIDYIISGSRQVVVHCPFCGQDDQSHHMSINLSGHGWRCWRAPSQHYGRSPVKLIRGLTGCSLEEAREVAGVADGAPTPPPTREVLSDNLTRLQGGSGPIRRRARDSTLEMPRSFHPLRVGEERAAPFVRYLERRGYRLGEIRWLAKAYDLQWAGFGPFAWRLIFPVHGRKGELLTWTGRAIGDDPPIRYKQPPASESRIEAPNCLLGLDQLCAAPDPRVLVICEGPLDATRISASGAALGVWGTCLFGLSLSDAQRELIFDLAGVFPLQAVLLDATAGADRLRIARQLEPLRPTFPRLPEGVEDPGALSPSQASRLCMELLERMG